MASGERYECIIIGGGPAGSTAGTLLAQYGHRVLLLEKERFPRHHIGESLMPQTYFTFQRLGFLEKLKASDFTPKESVQFISASGKESQPFYFTDRDPNEWSVTWQVERDRFDRMMLEHARESGVEVVEGALVKRVLFDGSKADGVEFLQNGELRQVAADVVIDASGQSALLSRQLGLRYGDDRLKNAAIYAYYRGVERGLGRNAGATLVVHTPDKSGWFWLIPLPNDVTSVGLVSPPHLIITGRGSDPLATLEAEIARCTSLTARFQRATRITGSYVTRDFSYRSRRLAGDGWVLIGDAFGFLDPIYSSGVLLALKSGEWAADAVHEALHSRNVSGELLGRFGPRFVSGMQRIRQLVYAFYDPNFSFAAFIRRYPQYHDDVVRVLIGDVFGQGLSEMFEVMSEIVKLPEPLALDGGACVV